MYSIPHAMSNANPPRVRGDRGVKLRPPGTDAGNILVALRAARNSDNSRPRIAYSIISICGSMSNKERTCLVKSHKYNICVVLENTSVL